MQAQAVRTQSVAIKAGIILTTLITSAIHVYLVQETIAHGNSPLLFILNVLGYLGLLAAYLLPQAMVNRFLPTGLARNYRSIVRYVFIAYTLVTILAWVVIGERTTLGYVDKLAEVILIVLLWLDRKA